MPSAKTGGLPAGAATVDFGAPTLSMHSIRELCGVADQVMYADALTAFLAPAGS